MTLSGVVFVLVGLLYTTYISRQRFLESKKVPYLLFIYHLGFTLIYWQYSLNNTADSIRYYRLALGPDIPFGIGTQFINWIVQKLYLLLEVSYLDLFILFHFFGFMGICLLYRIFLDVIFIHYSQRVNSLLLVLIFLPGLHFWTSAIGKESVIFLSINLVLWSLLQVNKRISFSLIGIVIIYAIRPHVAMVMLSSLGLALLWGKKIALHWRVLGSLIGLAIWVFVLPDIMVFIRLESMDFQSVEEYVQLRQGYYQMSGSGVDIGSYPFPIQVFTFLYRPLFFDSHNLLAWIISFENLILLLVSSMLFSRYFVKIMKSHPRSLFLWTNIFFFLIMTGVFSVITSNLGIAVRQKTMILPSLFILILATYSLKIAIRTKRRLKALTQTVF